MKYLDRVMITGFLERSSGEYMRVQCVPYKGVFLGYRLLNEGRFDAEGYRPSNYLKACFVSARNEKQNPIYALEDDIFSSNYSMEAVMIKELVLFIKSFKRYDYYEGTYHDYPTTIRVDKNTNIPFIKQPLTGVWYSVNWRDVTLTERE